MQEKHLTKFNIDSQTKALSKLEINLNLFKDIYKKSSANVYFLVKIEYFLPNIGPR